MMNRLGWAFICLLVSSTALSQNVDEIILKNLTARGGVERLSRLKTLCFSGIIQTDDMVLNMAFYRKMPGKMKLRIEVNGQIGITAFNGKEGWLLDPARNIGQPTKVSPEEVELLRPMIYHIFVFFDDLLVDYRKKGIKAESLENVRVDGKEAYKIKVLMPDSTVIYYYIDKTTNLDFRHDVAFTKMDGVIILNMKNFTNIKNYVIPIEIDSRLGNLKSTRMFIDNIQLDTDIDDSFFNFPN